MTSERCSEGKRCATSPGEVPSVAGRRAAQILATVRAIPPGFVRTYGDVDPRAPRLVGHVLAATRERVPWHRVVRADGSVPMGDAQRA